MVECVTFSDFQKIFYLTCVVSLQTYQDAKIDCSGVCTAKEARKKLEEEIAVRCIRMDFNVQSTADEHEDSEAQVECDKLDENNNNISNWVDGQIIKAKKMQCNGEELNPFFLPEFANMLSLRAKEFPLWTSVGMDYNTPHATSSYVESYFNDIKSRVLKTGPLRIDKFLIKHVHDIQGATLLFSSRMINFNAKRCAHDSSPIKQEKEMEINKFHKLHSTLENNDMKSSFCDLDLLATKNLQEKDKIDELGACDHLHHFDNEDVSYFVELASNDIEKNFDDSDLLAIENWRGKVQTNNNYNDFNDLNKKILNACNDENAHRSSTELSRELEITNTNAESMDVSFLDHSYLSSTSIIDLASPMIDLQNNNQMESENNLKEESSSIPFTHLVSKSKEQLPACHHETNKSKYCSKYFKTYPEIRQRNTLVGQRKKSVLLPNGSLRLPVKIKENGEETRAYSVTNTCAFDSLVHVLMTGGIDNVNYNAFLEVSSNPTLQLVYNLIQKGLTQYMFKDRVLILKSYYACEPQIQTDLRVVSYKIDAFDNIANVVKKILATVPSIKNTTKCNSCKGSTYPTVVLQPNHKVIGREGFGSLEKSLSFRSTIYQVRCSEPCLGKYTWFKEPTIHVFIELDIRPNLQCTMGLECRLGQMPATLTLENFEYRLAGIIAYISGHYIAYCLRSSGVWQIYDDLRKDISKCDSKTIINPHLAVYIRKQD